jgi:hypothetical protein
MTLDCSIIIPHKRTELNDDALKLNMEMLLRHTPEWLNYEVIIDTETPKDPYQIWNEAARMARSDTLIFTNTDVLFGPEWAILVDHNIYANTIVTGYLVEPGNIGVAPENIHKDFGKTPLDFDMYRFEQWVRHQLSNVEQGNAVKEERGWFMPCAMNKNWFNSIGGFPTEAGFPNPNDAIFWDKCVAELSTKLLRVPSYAYHFQNLSGRADE